MNNAISGIGGHHSIGDDREANEETWYGAWELSDKLRNTLWFCIPNENILGGAIYRICNGGSTAEMEPRLYSAQWRDDSDLGGSYGDVT